MQVAPALLRSAPADGPGDNSRPALFGAPIHNILIARGYVTVDEWDAAARQQPDDPATALVGRGWLTQLQVAEARATRWGLEWRRLDAPPDPALAREVPDGVRSRWAVAVLASTPDELVVAVSDPEPVQLRDAARGRWLRLVVVPASDLPPAEDTGEAEEAIREADGDLAALRALGQDTFIVRLTTDLIERAIALGASDIHIARFDEGGTGCEARFRVDGQL